MKFTKTSTDFSFSINSLEVYLKVIFFSSITGSVGIILPFGKGPFALIRMFNNRRLLPSVLVASNSISFISVLLKLLTLKIMGPFVSMVLSLFIFGQ